MPSLFKFAHLLDRAGGRRVVAASASAAMRLRRDPRRFAVDDQGRWVNRQPDATFVSPDLHTATYAQVRDTILDYWCQFYKPKSGDVALDIGAGIGEEAVVFSKVVGESGRVVSIEAHPGTFACPEATVSASGCTNVTSLQEAIADEPGTLVISDSEAHLGNTVMSHGATGTKVPAETIDGLSARLGLEKIDLLKMNIEGAEKLAVQGMRTMAPRVRHLAISCHDFVADRGFGEQFRTLAIVESKLLELGYEVMRRVDPPNEWARDVLFASRRP